MIVKCSLHNHTILSDGHLSPHELLYTLKSWGFKVIAITDHNTWTLPHELQIPDDIIFINGVEWTFRYHIIKLDLPLERNGRSLDWRDRLDLASVDWLAHPGRWSLTNDQIREICRSYKLDGAEVCNRGQRQFNGEIPGVIRYGVDDTHSASMIGKNWIEMELDEFTKEEVIENLKKGRFTIKGTANL